MTKLLDSALDRAVVPGYTRIGYWLRRRGWPADDPRPGALAGKRALVTGANSGLGKAAALGLARLGAEVHLVVRNEQRGAAALDEIRGRSPARRCTSSLRHVRPGRRTPCGADLADRLDRVDVLVHNAGAMPARADRVRRWTRVTVATHVLGPVLLTDLLRPVLSGHHARVVPATSGGMYTQKLPVHDPDYKRG